MPNVRFFKEKRMSLSRNRFSIFKILYTYNVYLATLKAKNLSVFARNFTHYKPQDKIS